MGEGKECGTRVRGGEGCEEWVRKGKEWVRRERLWGKMREKKGVVEA